MLVAAAIVVFFILGMFLSMLGSSPKTDAEWQSDAEPGEEPAGTGTAFSAVAGAPRV